MGTLNGLLLLCLVFSAGCREKDTTHAPTVKEHLGTYPDFTLIAAYPHDPEAYTQGLLSHDGLLYESTGLHGQSSLRKVDLQTGRILQKTDVARDVFSEGLASWSNELFQLSWKQGRCFVYDLNTLTPKREQRYTGEGWGLTQDGTQLIMSDGSDTLRFLDPATFTVQKTLRVTRMGRPQASLNELEYVNGRILANVWQRDILVSIDPATGTIEREYDLSPLRTRMTLDANAEVLNGIARHPSNDTLLVTGKWWPTLFEIELK